MLETEKKFIISMPDTEMLKSVPGCEYTNIEQIYLKNSDGMSERIRKRGINGKYKYYHTLKRHVTNMTCIEDESVISPDEYEELKKRADSELNIIYKTRYCIPYAGHVLEIDVFPFWKKQAFLEIELEKEDDGYEIPGYLNVLRDVTEERCYTNHSLAGEIPKEI